MSAHVHRFLGHGNVWRCSCGEVRNRSGRVSLRLITGGVSC